MEPCWRNTAAPLDSSGADGGEVRAPRALLDAAVGDPQAGGPGIGETGALLEERVAAGLVAGAHVTCFNPDLDREGTLAHTLVGLLARLS